MDRRTILTGCTPHAASVILGAIAGFLALSASGRELPAGIPFLLGGYAAGALGGFLLVKGLAAGLGEWWHE